MSLSKSNSGQVLELSNLQQYISKDSFYQEDRSLRNFLEMAVAQVAINQNIYTAIGSGKLFETESVKNVQRVDNGIILRSGIVKGVRIVQNFGNPCPALILDSEF